MLLRVRGATAVTATHAAVDGSLATGSDCRAGWHAQPGADCGRLGTRCRWLSLRQLSLEVPLLIGREAQEGLQRARNIACGCKQRDGGRQEKAPHAGTGTGKA